MNDNNEKKGLASILAAISSKLSTIFIIVGVITILAIGGYLVIDTIGAGSTNEMALALEALDDQYSDWMDAEEKTDSSDLIASYEKIQSDFKGSYADQRATVQIANILFTEEKYSDAGEMYISAGTAFESSYLTSAVLLRAGISYENAGDNEKAKQAYSSLIENHDATSIDIPRALFSLGRISEGEGDYTRAAEYYNQLIDTYTESDWTKLAQSRIIDLKVKGLYE